MDAQRKAAGPSERGNFPRRLLHQDHRGARFARRELATALRTSRKAIGTVLLWAASMTALLCTNTEAHPAERSGSVAGGTLAAIGDTLDVSAVGLWTDSIPWPVIAINAHVLPTGKVLAWGTPSGKFVKGTVWNPATDSFTDASLRTKNLFCSGHSFLPDGRLLVSGGHVSNQEGLADAHIYDPGTNTWSMTGRMNAGRWYPTNTTLPNGDVLVVGGSINQTQDNKLPQVWGPNGAWRDLTGAVLKLPYYPWMHVAPNGRVFKSGPDRQSRFLDTAGKGAWINSAERRQADRNEGTSVMYDVGKVIVIGGGNPPTNTAEIIDLNAPMPTWRYTNPMSVARRQHNATLLPDGRVLVTGGTSGPGFNDAAAAVFTTEVWDPVTERWTTLARTNVRRLYHSTAVLLPDGRVLSGGGGRPPGGNGTPPDRNHSNVQIFSPPYLFTPAGLPADRPSIVSVPSSVTYGQTFFVETGEAAGISKVTWIRLSSVTHRFNMGQRINRLPFVLSAAGQGLDVTAPTNARLCPPGHYMLFLMDALGVPSVAKIVRIG